MVAEEKSFLSNASELLQLFPLILRHHFHYQIYFMVEAAPMLNATLSEVGSGDMIQITGCCDC